MFNLDEEKIECTLGNRALAYWHGKKAENVHNQIFSFFMKSYVSGLSWSKNISKTSKKNEYKKTSSLTH